MWRAFVGLGLIACGAGAIVCQSVNKAPAFVIADVHPTPNGVFPAGRGPFIAGDRFELRSVTVLDMIRLAYSPANAFMEDDDRVVGGPSWLDFDRYDIRARVPAHSSYESTKLMLRTLLADRFKVVIRNDSAPLPAYVLTANQKPALKEAAASGESGCKREDGVGVFASGATFSYSCRNMTMSAFADEMRSIARADLSSNRVVDQTKLKGEWDFDFKFAPVRIPLSAGTTFIEAIQKQLGLDLTLTKVPTPVLVVAGANQKPTPNAPGVAQALPSLTEEFEVSDVKLTPPDFQGFRFQVQPSGRVEIQGATLKTLILRAWGLNSVQSNDVLIGPKFIDANRFNITAKAPTFGLPPDVPALSDPLVAGLLRFTDDDSIGPMLRTLLVQRFGLTFHNEDRPLPAIKLTATKPKLRKADPAHRTGCRMGPGTRNQVPRPTTLVCQNITMAQFAAALPRYDLARVLSRADGPITDVVDATALEGAWDFTITFTPTVGRGGGNGGGNPFTGTPRGDATQTGAGPGVGGQSEDPSGATFFEAMEKEVGLKLEHIRKPGQVMIIDHLEEKPKEP
jgi:uncharacterized protein (TIGR03435 family)